MFRVTQTVVDQIKETRRIALHQKLSVRMLRAERSFASYISVQPRIVHDTEISADKTTVEVIPADSRPGGVMITAQRMKTGAGNVEEFGESFANPGSRVILVGDCINANFGNKLFQRGFRPSVLNFPKRLSQNIRTAPDRYPNRTRVVFINRFDD